MAWEQYTVRVDPKVDKVLRREAERQNLSISRFVAAILTRWAQESSLGR